MVRTLKKFLDKRALCPLTFGKNPLSPLILPLLIPAEQARPGVSLEDGNLIDNVQRVLSSVGGDHALRGYKDLASVEEAFIRNRLYIANDLRRNPSIY